MTHGDAVEKVSGKGLVSEFEEPATEFEGDVSASCSSRKTAFTVSTNATVTQPNRYQCVNQPTLPSPRLGTFTEAIPAAVAA